MVDSSHDFEAGVTPTEEVEGGLVLPLRILVLTVVAVSCLILILPQCSKFRHHKPEGSLVVLLGVV